MDQPSLTGAAGPGEAASPSLETFTIRDLV